MSKKSIDDILTDIERGGKTKETPKPPIKFRKKKHRNWKKIIFLFFVLGVLVAGAFFGMKAYTAAKNIFKGGGGAPGLLGILSPDQLKGEGSGRINILLLGMGGDGHDGGDLTDTIMVVSIDPRTNEVAMLSLPRDLYVKINGYGSDKINAAHAFGERNKYPGGGPALAKEVVSKTLDINIHYYIRADFAGFSQIIDSVGGITVDVERDFCDYNYPTERRGDTGTVCFKAGSQNMNGVKALQYSRSRHAYGPEGSDFARAKRQQLVLIGLKEKVFSAGTLLNPAKMGSILDALGAHIKTDMELWEAQKLLDIAKKVDRTKVVSKVLDNGPDGFLVATSYSGYTLSPRTGNFEEIQNFVHNIFVDSYLKNEAATIEILNGSGVTGKAKTVADALTGYGYKIENFATADTIYDKTVIYDHISGTKPYTIGYLEKRFNVKSVRQKTEGDLYDITIIIGKDQ